MMNDQYVISSTRLFRKTLLFSEIPEHFSLTVSADSRYKLYVNGAAVSEPFLSADRAYTDRIDQPVTVGEGEVFVLGDNRVSSNDSRNPLVGAIPISKITGKAHFIVFPFNRWHGV